MNAILLALAVSAGPPPSVLLLDNEQVIEGVIERDAVGYRITRDGGTTLLPATRVVGQYPSKLAVLEKFRAEANLRDADERLRLARWCLSQRLYEDAAAEARAAAELAPRREDLRVIARQITAAKAVSPVPDGPLERPTPAPLRHLTPEGEIDRATFAAFVTRVQPILMNACLGCHGQRGDDPFRLAHAEDASDRRATLHNLAVLERVSRAELLKLASSPHGGGGAPIRGVDSPAYRTLELWVRAAGPAPKPMDAVKPAEAVSRFAEEVPKTPPTRTEATDPFDPAIFNGEIVPKK